MLIAPPYKILVFLSFLLLITPFASQAESINIGLYTNSNIQSITLKVERGGYDVFGDDQLIFSLSKNRVCQIKNSKGKIQFWKEDALVGSYDKIRIVRKTWGSAFRIKPATRYLPEQLYQDNLFISKRNSHLKLVNNVYLEHYVAGVVEAETGSKQLLEFYKLKSIICRTYALAHKNRHEGQGFHLCDQVHCQVYKGKARFNNDIAKAANETKGLVIVDSEINLITAAFHSNCGGHTVNAEDAWSYPLPYLKAKKDTFCLEGEHAVWEHRMPKQNWLNYLNTKHHFTLNDSIDLRCALNYFPTEKETYFADENFEIPLKSVRSDLDLNSTFFNLETKNDSVIFKGKGFGHGVGLCQEGAMNMIRQGFGVNEVIHFYYHNVHVIDLSVINFFREE